MEIQVLAPRTRTMEPYEVDYAVHRFPYLPSKRMEYVAESTMKNAPAINLAGLPAYLASALYHLLASDTDLIHTHLAIPFGILALLSRIPQIITCHGSDLTYPIDKPQYLPFTRTVLRKTGFVVTVSKYLEALAVKLGADQGKVRTIYLGVDPGRFRPRKRSGPLTIGTLGRLVPLKRVQDLILATKELGKTHDVRLRIGGDGLSRRYLESLADKVGLDSYEFTGTVTDPVEFHQSLDVFALCSSREGLSISLQEAMSCGVVPVAVDSCGCDELISPRENGFLFRTGDVADLTRKLRLACGATSLGSEAREPLCKTLTQGRTLSSTLTFTTSLGTVFNVET
ncbi:glycosyltransferase [Candidatus Bathyarchaeota archaeon]|nr:glycosyltransferase [Candidatus Bathyarchaeota archaeon]